MRLAEQDCVYVDYIRPAYSRFRDSIAFLP